MTCESYLDKAADNAGDFLRQEEYISYWPAGEINTMMESNLLKEGFMLACGSRGTVCHGRHGNRRSREHELDMGRGYGFSKPAYNGILCLAKLHLLKVL